jgi:hypothetical protein
VYDNVMYSVMDVYGLVEEATIDDLNFILTKFVFVFICLCNIVRMQWAMHMIYLLRAYSCS